MIGRSLSLQDTGAPRPEEELRRAQARAFALRQARPAAFSRFPATALRIEPVLHAVRTAYTALAGRWRPQPVRFWRELTALALLVMGLSWAVPWFRSLSQAVRGHPPVTNLLIFLALGLAAYLLARILAGLQAPPRQRGLALAFLLGASLLVGFRTLLYTKEVVPLSELVVRPLWALGNFTALIPNEVVVAGAVLLLWRRAAVLSLDYLGPQRVQTEFKTGFWMFVAFGLLNTLVTGRVIEFEFLFLFVLSGLLALGSARMASVGELRGGRGAFDRQRFLAMALGAGITAVLAYRAGAAVAADGGALAGALLGTAVTGAFLIAAPVLLLLLYGLYALATIFQAEASEALNRLLAVIDGIVRMLEGLRDHFLDLGRVLAERLIFLAPIFRKLLVLAPALRILVLLAVLAAAAVLVYAALAIRARRLRALTGEEDAAALDLAGLLRQLQSRLRLRAAAQGQALGRAFDLRLRRRELLANRIRRMYAALIDLAAEDGVSRAAAETPREFQTVLEKRYPDQAAALEVLTAAYLRVRYGELPEDRPEAARAEAAFRQLRQRIGRPGKD